MKKLHLALFGEPISNSLSPRIHQAFADQFELKLNFELISANSEQFKQKLEAFKNTGAQGCSITVPLKILAHDAADQLSAAAKKAGAVNAFHFTSTEIFGDNTDGLGWLNDLQQTDITICEKSVCVLGAGGAAAGLIPIITEQSPSQLIVANRDRLKAEKLLAQQKNQRYFSTSLQDLYNGNLPKFDLLINATSFGHQGLAPDLHADMFHPGALVYDLNYGIAAEPLKHWCTDNNVLYRDGLGMLVEQAAIAFELWTGKKPETQSVLESLRG